VKHHSNKAENRDVVSRRADSRLRVSAVLYLLVGACAPVEDASPLGWKFSLDCRADANRTEVVELKVAKGRCPLAEPVIFQAVTSMGSPRGSRPQGLPAGTYAFQATALDGAGEPVASYCESVVLPRDKEIALNLQGTTACGGDLPEDGGPPDNGNDPDDDGGVPTDASTEGDAGPEGGVNSCPDESDKDMDGVLDCLDQCPDDKMKSMPGQCGCGAAEADQDTDGTPDCVDMCPLNGNKTAPGTCGCSPRTTLRGGETLQMNNYLCGPNDDSVRLVMEMDGKLHLRVDGEDVWASDNTTPADYARMQQDGNFLLRVSADPDAAPWVATGAAPAGTPLGSTFVSVNANGTVTLVREGSTIWTRPE